AQDKLKLAAARFAKQGYGTSAKAFFPRVVLHLVENFLRVLGTMEVAEDLADHRLLVGSEQFRDRLLSDLPVVVDLEPQWILERKADVFALFVLQSFVEGCDQGLGL